MLISAALLTLALVIGGLYVFAPDALTKLAGPVWRIGNGASESIAGLAAPFANNAELVRAQAQLENDNLALNESNRTLRARVADLERLLGGRTETRPGILAGVLARPPVAPYDTLVVDRGGAEGVRIGAYAYGPGGVPLGTVESVAADSSRIALFSTGGRVTEGWIGEGRVPVSLTGKGGGAFEATLPRDSGVVANAVVYVPGPGALPIGTVVRVDSDPSAPHDTVHIAPYANLFALTWIEISP